MEIWSSVNCFVEGATLPKKQICKYTKSDVIRQYMSELSRFFYFNVLDICLAFNTSQAAFDICIL